MKTKLYKEYIRKREKQQAKAVRKIEHFNGRALLADQMRMGKTFIVLKYLVRNPKIRPALIICPEIGKLHWEEKAKRHFNIRGVVLNGTTPPRKKSLYKYKSELYIINWEIIQYWEEFFRKLKLQFVGLDECHYIKTLDTGKGRSREPVLRTRSALRIARKIPHIIAIGGTPNKNGRSIELWPILHLLRPDKFKSIVEYRWRYCSPERKPWGWEYNGAAHTKELNRNLLAWCMIRRLRKDTYNEPPKDRRIITLPITSYDEYHEAEDNFIKWLSKKSISKAKKAKKAERLVQFGYLIRLAAQLKMPYVIHWINNWLRKHKGKLAIGAIHQELIKTLNEEYHNISVTIDGKVRGKKRKLAQDTFQKNNKYRLIIGQIKAAGTVIELSKAKIVVTIELPWTPGDIEQWEDRIYKQFSQKSLRSYFLVAENTIEEDLCKILQKKQEKLSATLDGKKKINRLDIYNELQKALLKKKEK